MSQAEQETRKQVADAYTTAIRQAQAGSGSCCGPATPVGSVAKLAGYEAELDTHKQAGTSSFGCGNPLAFAGVEEGQTVLDLGSGAGLDLLIAADKVGAHGKVIGVDMTDAMIEVARENVRRAGRDNIEVRKGLIEELPVEDGSVDWVISNCVINLSPEKERVFKEIARVLAPGGRFSVSDIVAQDLPVWVREHAQAYSACVAGAISEEEYVAGLSAAGLVEIEVGERIVYDSDQICGLVESDLKSFGIDPTAVAGAFAALEGKVQSIRISGRKP